MRDLRELLVCLEQPERFAHGHSFPLSDLSDLSDSLTVSHLSWAIWANHSQSLILFEQNEQMSEEQKSKFPALLFTKERLLWATPSLSLSRAKLVIRSWFKQIALKNERFAWKNSYFLFCVDSFSLLFTFFCPKENLSCRSLLSHSFLKSNGRDFL